MELIINVMALFVGIALWMYGRYWRKTCGKVLCQYAAACGEREDREKLMRYAIIAGNPHAPLLYALTYPELFDKARPGRCGCSHSEKSAACLPVIIFHNVLKVGFVTTSLHLCRKCMTSRMGKMIVRSIFLRHSGFFPPTGMLRLCSCHAALPTVITDVFPALPVFWKLMVMPGQDWT